MGAGALESSFGHAAADGPGVMLLAPETERLYEALEDDGRLVVRVVGASDTRDIVFQLADVSRAKAAC